MGIRIATEADLPSMLAIYNEEVVRGTSTFDTSPREGEAAHAWLAEHNRDNHPLLVSEQDGVVVGYASLSTFNQKAAYSSTVELSVYVAREARGRGVATALAEAVLRLAREDPSTHRIVSLITRGNEASVRLHERLGFSYVGTLHEVGEKFGSFLDVDIYELGTRG